MNLNFLKIGAILFATVALSACQPDKPIEDGPVTGLEIKLNNYLMAVDGRESVRPFNLSTSQPWKVELTDEQKAWITVTPDAGEGNFKATKISVRTQENALSKLPRETEIKFKMIGNDSPKGTATLKITQGTEYFMKQDSLALVAFFNATDGPNWTKPWDLSRPIAEWYFKGFDATKRPTDYANGVWITKDATNSRRVNRLCWFEPIGQKGKFPEEMKNLTAMEMFELSGFVLEGQTFDEFMEVIGHWTILKNFWLTEGCKMGGVKIPKSLGVFEQFDNVFFNEHDFTGFADDFGSPNFPTLVGFTITNGQLEGELKPEYFEKMPMVAALMFGNNNLSGSISPKLIMGKPQLYLMELSGNRFTGVFPSNIRNSALWANMESPGEPAASYFCPQQPGFSFDAGTCE